MKNIVALVLYPIITAICVFMIGVPANFSIEGLVLIHSFPQFKYVIIGVFVLVISILCLMLATQKLQQKMESNYSKDELEKKGLLSNVVLENYTTVAMFNVIGFFGCTLTLYFSVTVGMLSLLSELFYYLFYVAAFIVAIRLRVKNV